MKKTSIGKVIASLRGNVPLSQEALAEKAGLHRTYISQLERGLKSPTLDTLTKIAAALNLQPSSLIQLTEAASDDL